MDYLRSAASAVLSKSAGPLPGFTIGAAHAPSHSSSPTIWSMHDGVRREDNSPCTIFTFEGAGNTTHLTLARNALRKLRTLRHPDVLKLIDSNETPSGVYIAVERVRRLPDVLKEWDGSKESKRETCVWGLSKVANALKFLHTSANSIHGNVRPESIFVSQGGQWRLGGFEVLTAKSDDSGVLWSLAGSLPDASLYASPEVKQGGWSVLKEGSEVHTLDSFAFALLACSAFNDYYPSSSGGVQQPPQGSIPAPLYTLLRRLMSPTAKTRMSVGQLHDTCMQPGGVFATNTLSVIETGCDGLMLASDAERSETISHLSRSSASLPADFLTHVVLPSLVNALTLSCQAASQQQAANTTGTTLSRSIHPNTLLPLVVQLGAPLDDEKWTASILPCIVECFGSADRSIRMTLLDALPSYISRVEQRKVSDAIWPRLVTGFSDSSAAIREGTLKSILAIAPKLSDRIKNNDLLRQLAKTQVDVEESIRTNTTILLGRLSPQLNPSTRKSVLIPAFSRSLKDPFVHARVAGLMAFMATSEGEGNSYDGNDLARSILPVVCVLLVDADKTVRDQAVKAVDLFLAKVKDFAGEMPDTNEPGGSAAVLPDAANGGGSSGGLASTAGGAASALAGWAMSGAMSYLSQQQQQELATGTTSISSSSIGSMDNKRPTLLTGPSQTSLSTSSSGTSTPLQRTESRSGSSSLSAAAPIVPDDLIDIEDDTADWSNFESAPVKKPIISKRTASSSSRIKMSSNGMARLSVRDGSDAGSSDAAWGGGGGEADSNSTPTSRSSTPSHSTTKTAASTAAAFKAPVPAWDNDDAAWGDGGDDAGSRGTSSPAAPAPVSREDKRAAMDRQREERRERMRKLKESKGKKLGDALV